MEQGIRDSEVRTRNIKKRELIGERRGKSLEKMLQMQDVTNTNAKCYKLRIKLERWHFQIQDA